MQVLFLGRAPRTKETLPDFLKWRRVTRPPLVFRGLTGSQRTPGKWGVTQCPQNDIERDHMKAAPYSSIVGSLMYVQVCICLDVAFFVGLLGRYLSDLG